MNALVRFLRLDFIPSNVDIALLVLRVWLGASMLLLHGWNKLMNFQQMSREFPDLFGLGTTVTLSLAVFGEVVCSALLILGLFTRFAALGSTITMAVAFFIVHKMVLSGQGSGEMAFVYLAGFLTILIAGPGRFSLDAKSGKSPRN